METIRYGTIKTSSLLIKLNIRIAPGFFILMVLVFISCKKEEVPVLTTAGVSSVDRTSAVSGGEVTNEGTSEVISKGVCWSGVDNPTIGDSITVDGSGLGSFTSNLIGLDPGTEYFLRAYATNNEGTGYGRTMVFTTEPISIPEITWWNFTSVTLTTVTTEAKIATDGGSPVIDRGFCWNTIGNPTLSDNSISLESGSDMFLTTLTDLEPNTCYHVRAYATNLAGTGYSKYDMIFPTLFPDTPVYPVDSIFGKWRLVYCIGGIGGGVMPAYNSVQIEEFRKDSIFIRIINDDIYRECNFSISGNVLKYSDLAFYYRIMIRGDNLGLDLIDTLDHFSMDGIWGYFYKRLQESNSHFVEN